MLIDRRAREHAERHRRASWEMPVTLRLAGWADMERLERLAALDSCRLPDGPHLVVVREGRIDAAISLSTGELVADPFRRTVELCALLRCHAGELRLRDDAPRSALTRPQPVLAPT